MKSTTGTRNLPENKWLIDDVFHELRSILSGILSSVELIEMYGARPDPGEKINRQAGFIKLQVIELEFQLQNVKIIQHLLNNTLRPHLAPVNIIHTLEAFSQDERYGFLFGQGVSFQINTDNEMAEVDELLLKQLVLNMAYRMMRNAMTNDQSSLTFIFEDDRLLVSAKYTANGTISSTIKSFSPGDQPHTGAFMDQRICQLIALIAEMHGGNFEIEVEDGRNVEMLAKIPYESR